MEENGRKRKETARIQHVGRDNQTSAKQIKVERSRSWPHSPRGDGELSQDKFQYDIIQIIKGIRKQT
jgi:hypothetical protein